MKMIILIGLLLSVITVESKSIQREKAARNAEQRARQMDQGPVLFEADENEENVDGNSPEMQRREKKRENFQEEGCYEGNGKEYRGVHATTSSGRKCQPWRNNWGEWKPNSYPELTSNHCRNPSGGTKPWCYWKEAYGSDGWEYCGVPKCSDMDVCSKFQKPPIWNICQRQDAKERACCKEAVQLYEQCREIDPKDYPQCYFSPPNAGYYKEKQCSASGRCVCVCKKNGITNGFTNCTESAFESEYERLSTELASLEFAEEEFAVSYLRKKN